MMIGRSTGPVGLIAALALISAVGVSAAEIMNGASHIRSSGAGAAGGMCQCDLVEHLLGVLRAAAEQYSTLMQNFLQLKHSVAARQAVIAVPVELSFLTGVAAAWLCAALGAARARRRSAADAQKLADALRQRTTQWKVAVAEATDLAALLQSAGALAAGAPTQQQSGPLTKQQQQQEEGEQQIEMGEGRAADAEQLDVDARGRDTDCSKPAERSAAKPKASAAAPAGDDADASDADTAAPRRLEFGGDAAVDEASLRALVDEFNRSLLEQGLSHRQLALSPATAPAAAPPPSSPAPSALLRAATPLSEAAAGAAAWPQSAPPLSFAATPAGSPAPPPAAVATSAEDVARMQLRISQLEAQVASAAAAAATPAQQQPQPLPAGALYVTHKEMELVQENAALRQQLQQLAAAAGADGWVTTTRGGLAAAVGGDLPGGMSPGQEVWMPATALAAVPWSTPPAAGRRGTVAVSPGGGILGGVCGSVTAAGGGAAGLSTPPPRGAFGNGGSARATPGSEGSTKTVGGGGATPPGSGPWAAQAAGGGLGATLPPLRAGSLAASAAGSPSKGSGGGTPRERMAAALHDSRTRIEQLALNLNALPLKASPLAGGREGGDERL